MPKGKRFCNRKCANKARSKQVDKTCECCGKYFSVAEYRKATTRFCSLECHGYWRFKNENPSSKPDNHLTGNAFRQGKRPTNAFENGVTGKDHPSWIEPIELTCDFCDKIFYKKPWELKRNKSGFYFCSHKCAKEGMRGDKDPRYIGGPKTYRGRNWPKSRQEAIDRDNGTCQDCGTYIGPSISVHHIIPFRDFDDSIKANRVENLVCLCQSCHIKREAPLTIASQVR